jgi:hypothetical protein
MNLSFFLSFLIPALPFADVSQLEKDALVALYNSVNGDS